MRALLYFILLICLAENLIAAEIKIHSNGNLKPILMELSHYYQTRNPETNVIIETGKIAEIKEKLEAKAEGDLIFGDEKLFEIVDKTGAIDNSSRRILFSDPVVAVADVESEIEITDPKELNADNFKKIALLGEKTPLGKQVRAYLEPRGLKEAPAEKKVEVADVKAALDAVKTGEAKWTLVYSSDASKRRIKHLFQVPSTDIPEVSFSVAVIKHSRNKEEAAKFIEAMQSTIGKKFFENAGFVIAGSSSKLALVLTQTKSAKHISTQTQTQPQTQSETQTQTQTQTSPQTQTAPQTQTSTEPQTQTQTKPQEEKEKD